MCIVKKNQRPKKDILADVKMRNIEDCIMKIENQNSQPLIVYTRNGVGEEDMTSTKK